MESTEYIIAKHIAENDSIGEGYSYCREYTIEKFNNDTDAWGYRFSAQQLMKRLDIPILSKKIRIKYK